MVSNISPVALQ